jgi:hypothetical protein
MTSLLLILALAGPAPGVEPVADTDSDGVSELPSPPEDASEGTPRARPTVSLVADDALREWLVVRLLDDGYALTASPDAAQVELTIASQPEGGWVVTATGASTVSFEVAQATDRAVIQLEVLHHCLDALEDVTPREGTERGPAARFSVAENSPDSLAAELAREVLASGVTLVPSGREAELQVCGEQRPGEASPRVVVIDGAAQCPWPVDGALGQGVDTLPDTQRRIAEALAGAQEEEAIEEAPEPQWSEARLPEDAETPPALKPPPKPAEPVVTPWEGASWVLRGGVAAGVVGREPKTDALLLASATLGREPGLGGWFELHVRPSTVTGRFRVVEVMPALGGQVRPLVIGRFSTLAGALVGADVHRYWLRAGDASNRGVHVAVSFEGMLGAAFAVWRRHEVQLMLRVGDSPRRVHRAGGDLFWRRSAIRVGATIGFTFGKELGA